MNPLYELIENELGSFISATFENGSGLIIPIDPDNSDYQAYLKSLETDNQ